MVGVGGNIIANANFSSIEKSETIFNITTYYKFDRNDDKDENENRENFLSFIISPLRDSHIVENVAKVASVASATGRFIPRISRLRGGDIYPTPKSPPRKR